MLYLSQWLLIDPRGYADVLSADHAAWLVLNWSVLPNGWELKLW